MGRKSKLTKEQWSEIQRRMLDGESLRSLAKEFGVSESSAREKISAQSAQIKSVANQIVATERAIQALPISAQITAHSLASKFRAISNHMASGSEYSAATFHRLTALAHEQVQKIDDAQPLKDVEVLRGISALQSMANDAAKTPINLIAANKDRAFESEEQAPMTLNDFYGGSKPKSMPA